MSNREKEFWNKFFKQFDNYYPMLYKKLTKVAEMRGLPLEKVILEDFKGLVKSFEERLDLNGLSF